MFNKKLRQSLGFKFLIIVSVILLASTVVISILISVNERAMLRHSLINKGNGLASYIAKLGEDPLIMKDSIKLDIIVNEAIKDEEVLYAVVQDASGNLLTSQYASIDYRSPRVKDIVSVLPKDSKLKDIIATIKMQGGVIEVFTPITYHADTIGKVTLGMSEHIINQQVEKTITFIVVLELVVTFIIGAILFIASKKLILDPITKLAHATNRFAKGELTNRVEIKTTGEVLVLVESFNLMMENIEKSIVSKENELAERKRAEEALRASEENYRIHFDNVSDVIFSFDREFRILNISPSLERVLGYKPEEFLGKPFPELNILPPEYLEKAFSDGMRVFGGEHLDSIIYEFIARDGTRKYGEVSSAPLFRDGQVVAAVSVARDITERKRSEEALLESEEQYKALVENIDFGVSMIDKDFKIIMTNSVLGRWFNRPIREFVGKNCFKEFEKRQTICQHCPGVKAIATGRPHQAETEGVRDDGSRLSVRVHAFPLFYPDGATKGFIEVIEDITERKLTEGRLKRQFDRLAALRAIDMAITASLDIRVTFSIILEQVINTLHVDAADVLLLNSYTYGKMTFVAGRGFRTDALRYTNLSLGVGYAGRVAQERKAIFISDLEKEAQDLLKISPQLGGEDFVTYYSTPLIAKGQIKGVLEIFNRTPIEPDQEWLDFLENLATQAAIAVDNAKLFDDLQKSNIDLIQAYDSTLEGWSNALDLRDKETEGHSQRVTEMTLRIASQMGMRDSELMHVRRGALLHDIGKMGVPDGILFKPGPLNDEEWEIMRKHPGYAYELLHPISYLKPALDIPYSHHEKWDGTGYPHGLKGVHIPLAARIFAIVDAWDALRSERPYRPAWPEEKAREYIKEQAGKHFDPKVVEVFLELLNEFKPV